MTTRKGIVAKKWSFPHKNDDENGCRRQKVEFFASKSRRERVSSPKKGIFHLKMTTRMDLVAKKRSFSAQNDDENGSRRQKKEFFTSKCRRERVSSPKSGVFRPKMMTRMDLVAKKRHFPLKMPTRTGIVAKKRSFSAQNADENGCRRQKVEFFASKSRRERASSPKKGIFHLKMPTRTGLVAKKRSFPHQNGDEKGSRRQKVEFPAPKCRRERVSPPKRRVSRFKMTTRTGVVAKKWSFSPQKDDENGSRR
ncbi:hypothetical protein NSQ14_17775 [Caldifermentibacillus hisashii]|uniref:hypothetical protein n=1 Tax=Caldifermentibacillus hisashii TaxID=996558 RepID=UPI0031FDA7DE